MLVVFENIEDGVRSAVVAGSYGFHVTLFDLESEEYLPTVKCFTNLDEAAIYAKSLVDGKVGGYAPL